MIGDSAFVLVDMSRAVVVPYRPRERATPLVAPPTKAEQEILDLSREKWRWMSEKKADTLAALFHDKAVFVHMGGSWGKSQEVEIIRSGGIHYKHAEIFESSARIIDSTAFSDSRCRLTSRPSRTVNTRSWIDFGNVATSFFISSNAKSR